jgi:hypothetical protein
MAMRTASGMRLRPSSERRLAGRAWETGVGRGGCRLDFAVGELGAVVVGLGLGDGGLGAGYGGLDGPAVGGAAWVAGVLALKRPARRSSGMGDW